MSAPTRRLRRGLTLGVVAILLLSGGALAFAAKRIADEQTAYSGPSAARCIPEHLDVSDVLPHTSLAVSPLPGSYDAMPETQISMVGAPASEIRIQSVTGSITGQHSGSLRAYSQGDGASFVPDQPFHSGEVVTVRGLVRQGEGEEGEGGKAGSEGSGQSGKAGSEGSGQSGKAGSEGSGQSGKGGSEHEGGEGWVPFSFSFSVAYPDPIPYATQLSQPRPTPRAGSVQVFHSAPELQPPTVDVTNHSSGVARGDIFLAPYSGPGPDGPTILGQDGRLIWMDVLPGEMKSTNLQVQTYEGKPVLTWWQGYIPVQGFGLGEEVVADTSYRQILHIKAGNGSLADLHDFHLEGKDTAVLTVFRTIHCDLSSNNGPRDAALTDSGFQEIDIKTGLVRREWFPVDHVALSESYSEDLKSSTEWPYDYFHINTLDPRPGGTTMISARNTSTLYVLDEETGQIEERIGGKKSSVKMGGGTPTAFQHDAMSLDGDQISIFDNGGSPFGESYSHNESRGLIVNLSGGADTLVRELKHPPALKAGSQGDVQLLPNGDWFVGWGQEPYFSEFSPSGQLLYDAHMWAVPKEFETESYRAYKFEWNARPYWPPSIAAHRVGGEVEAWASWNGATAVAEWRLLGGSSPGELRQLASASANGFETALKGGAQSYVEVQAVNAAGEVIGNSKIIKPS